MNGTLSAYDDSQDPEAQEALAPTPGQRMLAAAEVARAMARDGEYVSERVFGGVRASEPGAALAAAQARIAGLEADIERAHALNRARTELLWARDADIERLTAENLEFRALLAEVLAESASEPQTGATIADAIVRTEKWGG